MKSKRKILIILILLIIIIYIYIANNKIRTKKYDFNYNWVKDKYFVSHALGEIDGNDYTNSLEAFQYNYYLGQRIFETDFDLTVDGALICSHDEDVWRESTGSNKEYVLNEFENTKIYGKYTSLTANDLFKIMHENKDIYIITDTKYEDKKTIKRQFNQLVEEANKVDKSVLNRVIPQIYNEEMLSIIMDIYSFDSVIYTLYKAGDWNIDDVVNFCNKSGVGMITCNIYKVLDDDYIEKWKSNNIIVATHTINDIDEAMDYFNKGVDIIYTDNLIKYQLD